MKNTGENKVRYDANSANTLVSISHAILWIGIASYVLLLISGSMDRYGHRGNFEDVFNLAALLADLPMLLGSIFAYGIGRCIATITIVQNMKRAKMEKQASENGFEYEEIERT